MLNKIYTSPGFDAFSEWIAAIYAGIFLANCFFLRIFVEMVPACRFDGDLIRNVKCNEGFLNDCLWIIFNFFSPIMGGVSLLFGMGLIAFTSGEMKGVIFSIESLLFFSVFLSIIFFCIRLVSRIMVQTKISSKGIYCPLRYVLFSGMILLPTFLGFLLKIFFE